MDIRLKILALISATGSAIGCGTQEADTKERDTSSQKSLKDICNELSSEEKTEEDLKLLLNAMSRLQDGYEGDACKELNSAVVAGGDPVEPTEPNA